MRSFQIDKLRLLPLVAPTIERISEASKKHEQQIDLMKQIESLQEKLQALNDDMKAVKQNLTCIAFSHLSKHDAVALSELVS